MKLFNTIAIVIFLSVVGFIVYKVSTDSNRKYYETIVPKRQTIERKLHLPGNVLPIREVEVKPQLSGVLDKVYVEIGQHIRQGAPLATIRLVPNSSDVEQLENNLRIARIEYEALQLDYERNKRLFDQQTISAAEWESIEKNYRLGKEKYLSAQNQLHILQRGYASSGELSNTVVSPTDGVVIDIPIGVGASVIERNNYNVGTTIVVLAQMNRFTFRARIAEQYLKYITLGNDVLLSFNAYDSLTVHAFISKIAAKSDVTNGSAKYTVDAEFAISADMPIIRSGYSASAEILLERAANVLSLPERALLFRRDSSFVYVLDSLTHKPRRKVVTTGISDDEWIEIRSGISPEEHVITNYSDSADD